MLYKNEKRERLWALANMGELNGSEDSLSATYFTSPDKIP